MANTDLAAARPSSPPGQDRDRTPKGQQLMAGIGVYAGGSTPTGGSGGVDSNTNTNTNPHPHPRQAHTQATMALEQYRLQLYNYALNIERLRCPQYGAGLGAGGGATPWLHPYGAAGNGRTLSTISLFPQSQRIFQPEEPKPQHSYIGLIAMAILSVSDQKLVLSDIYQYILDNYPYFRSRGPGWRNSIRHNLSLNDCFIKSGRSANGKGHYWAIHPANMDDFRKGDFRRRKAQRKVRKHMGLSVDDASTDSPSPPPLDLTTPPPAAASQMAALTYPYHQHYIGQFFGRSVVASAASSLPQYAALSQQQAAQQLPQQIQHLPAHHHQHHHHHHQQSHIAYINSTTTTTIANLYSQTRKRQFDVASLLAPDVQLVDLVENKTEASELRQQTQTVITKVQVQKQLLLDIDLEPATAHSIDNDNEVEVDADIDVVDASDAEDGEAEVEQRLDDNSQPYLSAADVDNFSSISPQIAVAVAQPRSLGSSSSQHDSNSLEECPLAIVAANPTEIQHVELSHVDPHILSRYYGSYMAAAAVRRANLEASVLARDRGKSLSPPTH